MLGGFLVSKGLASSSDVAALNGYSDAITGVVMVFVMILWALVGRWLNAKGARDSSGSRASAVPVIGALCLLGAGCVSDAQMAGYHQAHSAYSAGVQQTFKPLCVEGTNMTVSITGCNKFEINAPLNKIESPQAPYDPAKDALHTVEKGMELGAMGYIGNKLIGKTAGATTTSTVNNYEAKPAATTP
jgi:hypothetical protein